MAEAPRVLFYVQHLLGIGHVKRAALISRALAAAGLETTLVSGGPPVPGLDLGEARLLQLPPLRAADLRFSALLDEAGRELDEAGKARRREALLAAFRNLRPQAVILEMYPFGRRQMRFELLPLLEAARAVVPRPLILSSLRDILAKAPTAERATWIAAQIEASFDAVLLHGDPRFVTLEDSFPGAAAFRDKLVYTGYVTEPAPLIAGQERSGVVVSAGGGAVGEALIEAALAARPLSIFQSEPWTVLVGPNFPEARLAALAAERQENLTVARAHPGFLELLSRASLSISQGGYNTVMDLLRSGPKAVIVPFAAEGEAEQSMRARLLEKSGAAVVLDERALTPAVLAEAMERAAAGASPQSLSLDLDGAAATAEWLGRSIAQGKAS